MSLKHSVIFTLVLAISAFLWAGCGSDDDPDDPTEPGWSIAYTADTQSPPANSVYLDFISSGGSDLFLSVNVKEVTDVYGAAFALHFDPAVFEYVNSAEGSFFSNSGVNTTYIAAAGDGVVTIGISLLGGEVEPVSGSGSLCSLVFRAVESGRTRFDYRENRLIDINGNTISGVQWFGGLGIVTE